jgi:hypothetical protein
VRQILGDSLSVDFDVAGTSVGLMERGGDIGESLMSPRWSGVNLELASRAAEIVSA